MVKLKEMATAGVTSHFRQGYCTTPEASNTTTWETTSQRSKRNDQIPQILKFQNITQTSFDERAT